MKAYIYIILLKLFKFILFKCCKTLSVNTTNEQYFKTTSIRLNNNYQTSFIFITQGASFENDLDIEQLLTS